MEDLPSYHEAISRKDWLDIVAPYVSVRDYHSLCLVSKRFYDRFAPRLWKDPLETYRNLRRDPDDDDYVWYTSFLRSMASARRSTASFAAILDYRGLAAGLGGAGFYAGAVGNNSIFKNLDRLPSLFPNMRCLLLDGHPDFDPAILSKPGFSMQGLNFMSMSHSRAQLPVRYFSDQRLQGLVYLDVSGMPGSLRSQIQQESLARHNLPMLRVFKARGREIDDSTAALIFRAFRTQLWSLDVSGNSLTDAVVNYFLAQCIPVYHSGASLRSDARFGAEGKMILPTQAGSSSYGPYYFVDESEYSADFSSPERHLADTPGYADAADLAVQEGTVVRKNGRGPVTRDSADDIKMSLTGDSDGPVPDASHLNHLEVCQGKGGTTHLHLDGMDLSSAAIQRLVRLSPGHIEHLECDSTTFFVNNGALPKWLSKSTRLYGFPGGAWLFRPVVSSNLRALRLHHSLVTNTPTLKSDNLTAMANLWLAETHFRERIDLSYPQTYIPDMNPRLYSLVLTKIPRYSSGYVIDRLIKFLRLAAVQEQVISNAIISTDYRAPIMLKGLRHIRLEFESDPKEDEMGSLSDSDVEDPDPEELIIMTAKEFSFFGENGWGSSKAEETRRLSVKSTSARTAASEKTDDPKSAAKLNCPPFGEAKGEHIEYSGTWNWKDFKISVWIGSGDLNGPHPAVSEYMKKLCDPELLTDVIPASPCHVAAGVPAGSYIFNGAWEAMLTPPKVKRPTRADLNGMRDVLGAIKTYRLQTKTAHATAVAKEAVNREASEVAGPHFYWTGKLEVELKASSAHSSASWR